MPQSAMAVLVLLLTVFYSAWAAPVDNPHAVAFSVGLSNTQRVNNKETILYDTVYVNERDGYSTSTGIFTSRVSGLYIFHFHAYNSNKDTVMWLDLLHNDNIIVSVSGYNSHTVASQTVMLKLRKGDRVQIQSKESQQFSLFGLPDQVYSTFTGYLIHPESNPSYMDSGVPVGK